MRYAQKGGYTPTEQQGHEQLRLKAAELFEWGESASAVATELRLTSSTVRRWREGGAQALRSKGPVSPECPSARQFARLEAELQRDPLAHGFPDDRRWTLKRIKVLVGRLFHVDYTVQGVWKLMRRLPGWAGWNETSPARGMERHSWKSGASS